MGPNEGYIWGLLGFGIAFLLSFIIHFIIRRRWLGCILQLLVFIVLSISIMTFLVSFRGCASAFEEMDAMVSVRLIEETRDCRYERTWWMKPDNTYYLVFDKGSNNHKVEPCGNDHYGDRGTFTRIDSICAIKTDYNPPFIIYFNLDSQKVTPVWGEDTLEVVSVDWKRINEYFKMSQ